MSAQKAVSLREYARQKGVSDTAVRKAIKAGKISASALTKHPNNGRPMIYPHIADAQWSENSDPNTSKVAENRSSSASHGFAQHSNQPQAVASSESSSTYNAARRAKAVYEAKLKELEYKEKLGQLVDKDNVYKQLFEFAQTVRSGILSVPDRFIDEIFAAGTRNEAHLLLMKALNDELSRLSDAKNIPLS